MTEGESQATIGAIPMLPALTTKNAVTAAMQPPSMPFMWANHQCIVDVGGRNQ